MRQELIDLEGTWYGGGFSFKLENDKSGNVFDYPEIKKTPPISDEKILKFWNNIEKLGVWNWKRKYPYWQQKYQPLPDQCSWKLKLRDRKGRAKYSHGYASFPRNFKKLINELNQLFESKVDWR